ncbi:MAG: hypothetical protein PHE02_14400, partial [Lachnospiraceae bacterium]|nr:hypothetical protein [Lachnospiraceae bacterium]
MGKGVQGKEEIANGTESGKALKKHEDPEKSILKRRDKSIDQNENEELGNDLQDLMDGEEDLFLNEKLDGEEDLLLNDKIDGEENTILLSELAQFIDYDDPIMLEEYLKVINADKSELTREQWETREQSKEDLQEMYQYWEKMHEGIVPYEEPYRLIPARFRLALTKCGDIVINEFWRKVGNKEIREDTSVTGMYTVLLGDYAYMSERDIRSDRELQRSERKMKDILYLKESLQGAAIQETKTLTGKMTEEELGKIASQNGEEFSQEAKEEREAYFAGKVAEQSSEPVKNEQEKTKEEQEKEIQEAKVQAQQESKLLNDQIPGFTTLYGRYIAKIENDGNVTKYLNEINAIIEAQRSQIGKIQHVPESNVPDILPPLESNANENQKKDHVMQEELYAEISEERKKRENVLTEVSRNALQLFGDVVSKSGQMTSFIFQYVEHIKTSENMKGSTTEAFDAVIHQLFSKFLQTEAVKTQGEEVPDKESQDGETQDKELVNESALQKDTTGILLHLANDEKNISLVYDNDSIALSSLAFGTERGIYEKTENKLQTDYYDMKKKIFEAIQTNSKGTQKLELTDSEGRKKELKKAEEIEEQVEKQAEEQVEKQVGKQAEEQVEKQAEEQVEKQAEKQVEKQVEEQTEKQIDTEKKKKDEE